MDVAEGRGVEVLAEPFDLLLADAVRVARVGQLGGQVGRESETVVDLAEQKGPGVVGDSRIGLTELDRLNVGSKSHPWRSPMTCISR